MNEKNGQKKIRRMIALGMACLAIGLCLREFVHPLPGAGLNALHAVFGFLIGFSIVMNLGAVIMARRQRRCASE